MDIQTVDIVDIQPAAYNPRKDLQPGDPEYEKLRKSIAEFDLVEPLVWNKQTGNLVGGHQRLKILQEQGHTSVEVSVVDLPEDKEKALNLALNKISGEWDMPRLKDLLEELDTGEIDMDITGFDLKEIEDLMTQFHVPGEGLTDDDAIPEKVETVCKTGDLWILGGHRLLCGDATKKEDVDRLMEGQKADMLLIDPPYGLLKIQLEKGVVGLDSWVDGKRVKATKYAGDYQGDGDFDIKPTLALVDALGIEKRIIWGGNYFPDVLPTTTSWICWDKTGGNPNCKTIFSEFELAWTNVVGHARIFPFMWLGFMREGQRIQREHPTQKPVPLYDWILDNWTMSNDLILDLFGGSGSTLIACEKLGRRCYMMEIDEHYCDIIIQRWQDFTGRQAERG